MPGFWSGIGALVVQEMSAVALPTVLTVSLTPQSDACLAVSFTGW